MSENLRKIIHSDGVRLGDDNKSVVIIDQTQLPNRLCYITLRTAREAYDAIKMLRVRGAPAIGICAAYSFFALASSWENDTYEDFAEKARALGEYLAGARPTAVNLGRAVDRMERVVADNPDKPVNTVLELLGKECRAVHEEDIASCRAVSEYGLGLIKDGDGILTHCNAGPLATSRYGTALGPLFLGRERGMRFRVFCDETRPLLQGARLTSFELCSAGIDATLICDSMASAVMKNGWINACFVGCDRIAANGDTANKIGTSAVAILAKYYGIPFYVLGPTSTVDLSCPDGGHIPIELRGENEIREKWYTEPMAPPEVKCYNPAFDVTDHTLITGIVTEKGICRAPFAESLAKLSELG